MSQASASEAALPGLSSAQPRAPEDHLLLRLAQLLLLLDELDDRGVGLERLGYYDFFAANPFTVFSRNDVRIRAELHSAGFDERQLSYASAGPRFANRRHRLQHDVSILLAYGLVSLGGDGYVLTPVGRTLARQLLSLYASQYRVAVRFVQARFKRLSDAALTQQARTMLRHPALLLDLYGSPEPDEEAPFTTGSVQQ